MRHRRTKHGWLTRQMPTILLVGLLASSPAHASLFSGDTLDFVANVLAWVVLFIAPIIAISVFWLVHILPEKIAEKRHHPQANAIKTLCLLSLFFGGMLWPLAWLWAYSKPVLHKLAYGTDVDIPKGHEPQPDAAVPIVSELRNETQPAETQPATEEEV
jgi:hypothetical protein